MKKRILFIPVILTALLLFAACAGPAAPAVTETEAVSVTTDNKTGTENAETDPPETEKVKEPEKIVLPKNETGNKQKTQKVTALTYKSVHQRTDSDVRDVIIYCETEPGATVYVCDKASNVLRCEKANGPCFYTALPLEEGGKLNLLIYAKADGKALSDKTKLIVTHTDATGENVYCGRDSRIFLNWYDDHYYGRVASDEADLQIAETMIRQNLELAREKTGKNTKIIVLVATNPAVIYHDRQYEEPFGRGDSLSETSSTLLAKRLKDDPDIYFIDLREVLLSHRDEEIFYQTDSHWTQLGGYHGYLEMMKYVHKDFPDAPVAELLKYNIVHDYRISDLMTDNFLNGYVIGMREYTTYIVQTPVSKVVNDNSPSMYYVGDSYTGCISAFFSDSFSKVTTNELYNYDFKNLEKLKPDYLVYVFNVELGIYSL